MAEGDSGLGGKTPFEAAVEDARDAYRSPDRLKEHKHASMLAGLELHRALADSQALLMGLCEFDDELKDSEVVIKAGGRVIVNLKMQDVMNANSAAIALARRNLDAED